MAAIQDPDMEPAAAMDPEKDSRRSGGAELAPPCETCVSGEAAGSAAPRDGENEDEAAPKLSKNQQKKLLRQQRFEEKKAAKKQEEKSRRHADVQRKKREWAEMLASLPPEERDAAWARKMEGRKERRVEGETRKARMAEAMVEGGGQDVVIDLEWGDFMSPKELKSLMKQIQFCYAANSRAEKPVRLHLSGCDGPVLEQLQHISGYHKWLLHKHAGSYMDAFAARRQDLVYLTADAAEVVESFGAGKVYIIGGLVDRNRHKNCTLAKAREQGIATARLPIGEHMKLSTSMVLTVNQVLDIMLRYAATGDWRQALDEAVPLRKRASVEEHRSPGSCASPGGVSMEGNDMTGGGRGEATAGVGERADLHGTSQVQTQGLTAASESSPVLRSVLVEEGSGAEEGGGQGASLLGGDSHDTTKGEGEGRWSSGGAHGIGGDGAHVHPGGGGGGAGGGAGRADSGRSTLGEEHPEIVVHRAGGTVLGASAVMEQPHSVAASGLQAAEGPSTSPLLRL